MSSSRTQSSSSAVTLVIAFTANLGVALAKTAAATFTGSAAMLAEAAHSWADTGNQVLLLIGERRSRRKADTSHPMGYGRSAYVWAMFAAIGLFTVGAVVSIGHGIQSWNEPDAEVDYFWAYAVLAIAAVLEGTSFLQARRQAKVGARARKTTLLRFVRSTSDPMLRAVYAEDATALIGLAIAAGSLAMHQLTGSARWDAAGSILVGLLLGVVAILLISRNASLLTGEGLSPRARARLLSAILDADEIDSVSFLHTEWIGADQVLVVAAVDISGNRLESDVQTMMQQVEDRLEQYPGVARALLTLTRPGDPTHLSPGS